MNDLIRVFLDFYKIDAVQTSKRAYQYPELSFFKNDKDFNEVVGDYTIKVEPVYQLQVPESVLEEIARLHFMVFDNDALYFGSNDGARRLLRTLMLQKERENIIRNSNPAVKQAYENYSMLLSLCENNKKEE